MINIKRYKWIVVYENKILSLLGFRPNENNRSFVPRFFDTPAKAKKYMQRYKHIKYENYKIEPVIFTCSSLI